MMAANRRSIKILRNVAVHVPLAVFAFITLIPFAYLFFSSLKNNETFFTSPFWPARESWWQIDWSGFTLNNYVRLFETTGIGRAVVNSFFYASVTAVLGTLCSAMGGYALAKFRFRGQRVINWLVLGAIVVPGALLLAPGYQVLFWLGLLDSYAGLILPAMAPAFGVFLFRQTFLTALPTEMLEAGRIDGCGEIRMFFQIALPMVLPMVGALLLITYLGTWNNFIGPQIVLQTPEKYPLAVAVAQLRGPYGTEYGMIMSGTLIAVAPVLILFLILQKDFIAGLTAGSIKG